MASRQGPTSFPKASNTMGIKGSSTNNQTSNGKGSALPKGADTLGLKGGTSVGNAGRYPSATSIPVGVVNGPTTKK